MLADLRGLQAKPNGVKCIELETAISGLGVLRPGNRISL